MQCETLQSEDVLKRLWLFLWGTIHRYIYEFDDEKVGLKTEIQNEYLIIRFSNTFTPRKIKI